MEGFRVKKARSALCALCLALLVPLLMHARRVLPVDSRPLVEAKYAGWSGVLRLWVFEGWESGSGSLSAWLNSCAARFEKRHPGVYIQPQAVDAGAIAGFTASGILPPDMLLFPPGLLASPEGLAPLEVPDGLRAPLKHCGAWGAMSYALPVAMGSYLWAWDAGQIDGIPNSWREAGVSPAARDSEPWRHWDAALLALCSGQYAETSPDGAPIEPEPAGVDLGLEAEDTPAPTATPEPCGPLLPCRLPEGFAFDGDAWTAFVNGEAAATPVTQREVRRLQALSEVGKGPDWRLATGGGTFTDQMLFLGVVEKPDAEAQRALCREFALWLLSDACQGALAEAGAFSVTGADSGYAPGDPLAQMDAALRSPGLVAPNCFDQSWPETAGSIVREFISETRDSPALWRSLAARLEENPNIHF